MTQNSNPQATMVQEEARQLIESADQIRTSLTNVVRAYTSFEKTYDDWHKELVVKIDPAADPARVVRYCSDLSNSVNIAYRLLSRSKLLLTSYIMTHDKSVNDKIQFMANNSTRKVLPSADTLDKIANSSMGDRVAAKALLEAQVTFWTDMVFKIKEQIRLVNMIAMSNGTLYKIGEPTNL